MSAADSPRLRYRFGDSVLDQQRRELRVHGRVVPLQPRAFDLLSLLVSRPGEALSKELLIASVWPTTHVTDAVLSMAAARIRKAIGDTGDPPLLSTLHGIGYRFDAAVQIEPSGLPQAPPGSQPARSPAAPAVGDPAAFATSLVDEATFWRGRWDRALALEAEGNAAEALALLEQVLPHQASSTQHELVLARLLLKRLRLQEAEQALSRGLRAVPSDAERAEFLLLEAQLALQRHQLPLARELAERAKEAVVEGGLGDARLPDVLAFQARQTYLSDGFARLLALADQIEGLATLPRHATALADAALARARALAAQELSEQGLIEAERALQIALAHGDRETASGVARHVAVLHGVELRLRSALRMAHWSSALADAGGQLGRWQAAQAQWVFALERCGQLDEAEQQLAQLSASSEGCESALTTYNVTLARACCDWRRGASDRALTAMQTLHEHFYQPSAPQIDLEIRLAECHLVFKQPEAAESTLQRHEHLLTDSQRSLLQAGIAMARGDREGAKRVLRRASAAGMGQRGVARRVALSLALLQLEDGESHGMDELFQGLQDVQHEHPAVALLFALRRGSASLDATPALSSPLILQGCWGIRHRHGWLLEPAGLLAWRRGERRLEDLLHTAWY